MSQKRGLNGSTEVIGYADSEYDIVNNRITCVSEFSEKRGFNRYIGVIGSEDSEYINANIT